MYHILIAYNKKKIITIHHNISLTYIITYQQDNNL